MSIQSKESFMCDCCRLQTYVVTHRHINPMTILARSTDEAIAVVRKIHGESLGASGGLKVWCYDDVK